MITLDDLLRVEILKDLPPENLAALLPHLTEKTLPSGSTIIHRGDPGSSMFMVLDGTVAVTLNNDEGIEYSLATMGAGNIFGEMALMTGEPRSANVKSLSEVHLLELDQKAFFELVTAYPALNDSLIRLLVQRRAKTAVRQSPSEPQRKGNIATLFAQPPPAISHLGGKSRWANETNAAIERLAASTDNLLICGERGTGKDLAARLIHFNGPERSQPLYHLDCATPPPVQREIEAERVPGNDALHREVAQSSALFGHSADAGSYAKSLRRGYLELADGGAVVLVNIDSLSPPVQHRLVQYLKSGRFSRIGAEEQISSRVRILATTSKPAEELGQDGHLDPELLAMVGHQVLNLKPLRERKKDIATLAEYFLKEFSEKFGKSVSGFSKEALNLLVGHSWPLNIDGLRQTVERAVVVATGETIEETQVFLNTQTFSTTGKYNLLRNSSFRKLVEHQLFPTGLRYITIPFILTLILFTLAGPEENNPANLIVWAVWWPILIISIILSGRAWCGYCPLPIISDGINFYRKKFLTVPGFLVKNGVWIGIAGFAVIMLAEHIAKMFTVAHATSTLLLTILAGTVTTNFFFGKRAWCKHVCPLGKMVSQTSVLSFIELDSNSTVCSSQCQTHDCVKDGNCPMGLHPSAVATSNDCILCLSCVKRCKHQSVRINARLPWREIQQKKRWDVAGAFFAIMLAALVLAVKVPSWQPAANLIARVFGGGWFVLDVVSSLVIGVMFIVAVILASGFPKNKTWRQNFSIVGYAYLSLACAGFFNIYFHEFVYHGHNLGPWILSYVGAQSIVPADWVTPELGTLKILIPLLTIAGAMSSWFLLHRLARAHSIPLFVRRMNGGILLLTTLVFLIVL